MLSSCCTSHSHCVCKHSTLLTCIFDPEVVVPKDYVAAEQSRLRKKIQKLGGAAGPKCARLIAERRKDNEKKEMKLQYLEMEGISTKSIAIADFVIADVVMRQLMPLPSEDDDSIEVEPIDILFQHLSF
jgi:hypothetical protein